MSQQAIPSEADWEQFVAPPPQYIGLDVTQRCNLQCPMCYFHGRTPHDNFVGHDMRLEAIDRLAPVWPTAQEVTLTGGGEPLLLRSFPQFIDKCHDYNPNLRVKFISNGVLMNERTARIVIEKRVYHIEFSIDGTIHYGHVGGGANYAHVKNNLRRLARLKKEYDVQEPIIGIAFVAMRDNLCELPSVIEFASEIEATVRFQPLSPTTEEQRSQNVFRYVAYTRQVLEECQARAQQLGVSFESLNMTPDLGSAPRPCDVPQKWLWLSHDGRLRPCCGGVQLGQSIYEKGLDLLRDVWNGPVIRRLRWELNTGSYGEICRQCPTLWNTIENQERAIPKTPEEQIARQQERIYELGTHLAAIRRGKVMRLMRTVNHLMGKE